MQKIIVATIWICLSACASSPNERAPIGADELKLVEAGEFRLTPSENNLRFSINTLAVGKLNGSFEDFEAELSIDDPLAGQARLNALVDTRSLDLASDVFREMARGPNWFDVERYPTAKFTGQMERWTTAGTGEVEGQLTIRDVTKQETFKIQLTCEEIISCPEEEIGILGVLEIKRSDYGMSKLSGLVSDNVRLNVSGKIKIGQERP